MNITWLGHSSFLLSTEKISLVTDPFDGIGYPFPCVSADVVTVSHGHFDHNNASAVHAASGAPIVLNKEGCASFSGLEVSSLISMHDDFGGQRRGLNLIFRFEFEEGDGRVLRVCHLGDLGEHAYDELIERIGVVDVLLIPVGGTYTITALQAIEFVDRIKPRIAIPMHYKTEGLRIDISDEQDFLAFAEEEGYTVERVGSTVSLSAASLPEKCKIIVMERVKE